MTPGILNNLMDIGNFLLGLEVIMQIRKLYYWETNNPKSQ
jgi:hypothetical protein